MPFHPSARFIASAFIAGLIAMPAAALAQTAEQPSTQQQDQISQPDEQQEQVSQPDEQQLESFADATILIVRIQEEAQQRMQSAVEEAGLTLEQYNEIAQAAQADPELDQTLQTMIRERLGG